MSVLPREVEDFVAAASLLTVGALGLVRRAASSATAAGIRDASDAPTLSAAHFSALDRRVRDAFRDRGEKLRADRPGGLRAAIAHTTLAAQTIWRRDRIDAERYRALVGPFRDVGIGVPDRE